MVESKFISTGRVESISPEDKLVRIRNIIDTLNKMVEKPHYQKTIGVDELRRRAIAKISEVVEDG